MENEDNCPFGPSHPMWAEVYALRLTVAAIRRARGKPNLNTLSPGTPEYEEVAQDFARDVLRAIGDDSYGDDFFGVGAAG
ncbi:hypothetical protein [Paraburkholderia ginsengisoli]|uniref:Uncharacterized protein n=1 Tax=Paraburkholderia ginsengisoli TaxID=311231 RepID=A0A7T4N8P6_9BURK|nr:hypothetical protein [Paraburkholderia ginsengisoli]QQC67314.1 hypothetical protein I6I06_20395 [Paraburkholderia ginsengisoli]